MITIPMKPRQKFHPLKKLHKFTVRNTLGVSLSLNFHRKFM